MQSMIFVGSISNAMRGKRVLEAQGLRAYIRHTTQESGGCGYSLLIPSFTPQAAALLRANGLTDAKGRATP